ncbi:2,3-diaminopropionate biosynthesis protein SbnB [Luteipulveratus sp. YIM 133132]|uniref:2,3-diaminopropionate biosynthesis protein SbnB n=1 Tax=Luteipulveratus flavus TaxID=3031728 RepID=UPI0023AFE7F9|nr:2,3-diaminopropionate biosynthesis protein SbnB [Luteipulveratus sp. YIM 133132]MDE9365081.1 2,3-diaminopropionate biosynthesis protein SbnB [Luteipulveratus sp. YIM 133132]
MTAQPQPAFTVISGEQVSATLAGREKVVLDVVRETYLTHERGLTVNPPSYFLRFEDRPANRIIALPASVAGEQAVDGIKWISSVPANIERGIPRASAVVILNDPTTGYPYACLEASIISAARTAASAALGAQVLGASRPRARRLGIVGGGLIARYVHHYLQAAGGAYDEIGIHDLSAAHAGAFADYLRGASDGAAVTVHDTAEGLVRASDLVVLATVAPEPYLLDPQAFSHHPVVLNVSLRDLGTEVIRSAVNVVDDVEHCLKANTSVHLMEQELGHRDFLAGTLAQVIEGEVQIPADRTVVLSPFGLGVLDLALARYIHDELGSSGALEPVPGFFHEMSRTAR